VNDEIAHNERSGHEEQSGLFDQCADVQTRPEAFVNFRQSAMTRSSPQDAAGALRRTPDVARGA